MRGRGRPPHPDILTPREWEVLALVREGLSNTQIAERLGISYAGAKYHVQEILSKLGVSTREEAARWSPEAGPAGRAWVLAPLAFIWRKAPGPAAYAAGATALIAVVGGLALLAVLLLRGGGPGASAKLPITLGGDRLGISALDGNPPVALTGPGSYSGAVVGADGRLRYFRSTGETGFYRLSGDKPELVIPVPPLAGVFFGEWSPDGSKAAWIQPTGGTSVLRIATPGGTPRTLGPEGLASLLWSPDGKKLLAFRSGQPAKGYVLDAGVGGAIEVTIPPPLAWSSAGDVVVWENTAQPLIRNLVLMHQDGSGRRVLGQQFVQLEGANYTISFSPDGRWLAWDSAVDESGSQKGVVVQAVAGSTKTTLPGFGPAWSPDGGRLAWSEGGHVYVAHAGDWVGQAIGDGFQPVWSPDGSRIAYVRGQQPPLALYARLSDGSGSEVKVVDALDTRAFAFQVAWWPDGSRMAVTVQAPDANRALSFDLKSGELRDLAFSPELPPLVAPDGSGFAYAINGSVTLIAPDGTQRSIDNVGSSNMSDWSRDGRYMLFVGGALRLLDLGTGQVRALVEGNVQDAVLSPDDRQVAYVLDQRLNVLDLKTGESRALAPQLTAMYVPYMLAAGHLAWSPDGNWIAVADWRAEEPITQGHSDVYAVDVSSGEARRLTDSPRAKHYFSWSPDGRYVAYLNTLDDGDHVRVIEISSGRDQPVDTISYTSAPPQWVNNDELLVNGPAGISFVKGDGSFRLLVQGGRPCSYGLLGFAQQRLYFWMRCSHGGL